MNDFDRDNLDWFLSCDQSELNEWYDQATVDDLLYMATLLRQARTELMIQEQEILDSEFQDTNTLNEAQDVLKKIMEKK